MLPLDNEGTREIILNMPPPHVKPFIPLTIVFPSPDAVAPSGSLPHLEIGTSTSGDITNNSTILHDENQNEVHQDNASEEKESNETNDADELAFEDTPTHENQDTLSTGISPSHARTFLLS